MKGREGDGGLHQSPVGRFVEVSQAQPSRQGVPNEPLLQVNVGLLGMWKETVVARSGEGVRAIGREHILANLVELVGRRYSTRLEKKVDGAAFVGRQHPDYHHS